MDINLQSVLDKKSVESVSCLVVSDSLPPHGPVACQAPLSMGFSR